MPVRDAASIMVQLLTALDYAHGQGVVHGNIAPSRLLLTSKGEVGLTDFGIGAEGSTVASYMSPEQLEGLAIDRRSDSFSAGVLFYELLIGANPFAGPPDRVIQRVSEEKEKAVSSVNTNIPRVFDAVCARALAKTKDDRYQTAGSFSDDIRNACETAFGHPPRDVVSNDVVVSIFLSSLRGPSKRRSSSKSGPQLPEPQPLPRKTSSQWEDPTLRAVEKQLAVYVGPVARVMIKEAASKANDLDELYMLAAESLDKEDDRCAFLARKGQADGSERRRVHAQQASVSPDSATAAMLRAEVKPKSKRSSLTGRNDRAPQIDGDADSLSQNTGREKVKAESKAGVGSGGLVATPRANAAPDSTPIAMPASEPQVKAQSDEVLGLTPDITAKTNSEKKSELRPRPPSQPDVASRLEELLGKQPVDLAGYLRDSPPQLDAVIYAFRDTCRGGRIDAGISLV